MSIENGEFEIPEDVKAEILKRRRIEDRANEQVILIEEAVRLAKLSAELEIQSQEMVGRAVLKTISPDSFRMHIEVPAVADAYVVNDGDVVVKDATNFDATELRSIGRHGVRFLDRDTGDELHIPGFDFEISPIIPEGSAAPPHKIGE